MIELLWKAEERLWRGGVEIYDEILDPKCIMAFPPPAGVMTRDAIVKSIESAPRWTEIEMADRKQVHPHEKVAILAYRATARRPDDGAPYVAICTSAYVERDAGWRMVQHQQSPIELGES